MGKIIKKSVVERVKGKLYYIDGKGNVCEADMKKGKKNKEANLFFTIYRGRNTRNEKRVVLQLGKKKSKAPLKYIDSTSTHSITDISNQKYSQADGGGKVSVDDFDENGYIYL